MDIRILTPDYAVSPQIAPEDFEAIRAAGFATVLCNRPDAEIPPSHHASVMEQAAEAAGVRLVINPIVHSGLSQEVVALQIQTLEESDGPVLAYCASGTRSSIVWCLGMAAQIGAQETLECAANAGYDLAHLRPHLDALCR